MATGQQDHALAMQNRLSSIRDLYLRLKEPAAHNVETNYEIVKQMQDVASQAERQFAWDLTPSLASQVLDEIVRIHVLMACSAILIDDFTLFELHTETACRRVRQYRGFEEGRCHDAVEGLIAGYPVGNDRSLGDEYSRLKSEYEAARNNRVHLKLTFDRSTAMEPLSDFSIRALPDSGNTRARDDAQLFADGLEERLKEPIVKYWFFSMYESDAQNRKLNLQPMHFIDISGDDVEIQQWANDIEVRFKKEKTIEMVVAMPAGLYYVGPRWSTRTSYPNLVIDRAKGQTAKGFLLKMAESAQFVDVTPEYEQSSADETKPGSVVPPRSQYIRPKFEILDFSLGRNNQAADVEGNLGGRMFQRFGNNLALQTQGQFEFRYRRDRMGLDQLLAAGPPAQTFQPHEKRGLTDYGSKEFQLDAGPVLRFGPAQLAVMQSLRFVRREDFDSTAMIGQFFFNVGYLFKNVGQIGFFATKANFDERVVKTVQLDQTLFEETYLKVTDQLGTNFQLRFFPRDSYLEGTAGYLRSAQFHNKAGGLIRYVIPPFTGKWHKVLFTAEAAYNESFVGPTDSWRLALGMRFGDWGNPSTFGDKDQPGAVPVIVPRVQYETLTRTVRRGNRKPIADAGSDQLNVDWRKGDVILDGGKSYDPDGDTITYNWAVLEGPASLSDQKTAHPRFKPENATEYVFQLTVADSQGLESDPDTVRVTTLRIEQPVIDKFTVTPSTISPNGDCPSDHKARLEWEVTGASTVSITNLGPNLLLKGEQEVSPPTTTTYTLAACNVVHECTSASVTLTVKPCAPVIVTFKADHPEILPGNSATLTWEVKNAERVTLTNKTDGMTSQVGPVDHLSVTPNKTTTYTLTACSLASECVSADVTVTVRALPAIVTFKAVPPEIFAGNSSTLIWEVKNANQVTLTNKTDETISQVGPVGHQPVTPAMTTVYTLTACNVSSDCVSANVTVTVNRPPKILSFTAVPSTISASQLPRQYSQLTWDVQNEQKVTVANLITGDIVDVTMKTTHGHGTLQASPPETTTYRLTVYDWLGRYVTEDVTVTVTQ